MLRVRRPGFRNQGFCHPGCLVDSFEQHRVLLAVLHHFSAHFSESLTIPDISWQLGISLIHIETAFEALKGITANQALLEYRLNRLCDVMYHDPALEITDQIVQCGLSAGPVYQPADFIRTDQQFVACFGIDLIAYHQRCFLAHAARLQAYPVERPDFQRLSTPATRRVGPPSTP